jgi:transposase
MEPQMPEPKKHPAQRRYPQEMKDRGVRMAREVAEREGDWTGVIPRVARQLGVGEESLRGWVKQAEVDAGHRPGVTSTEQARIADLEREVKELRRANEILKLASAFFARELDPRLPR